MIVQFSESAFTDWMPDRKVDISLLGWKMRGDMSSHVLVQLHTSPFKLVIHSPQREFFQSLQKEGPNTTNHLIL